MSAPAPAFWDDLRVNDPRTDGSSATDDRRAAPAKKRRPPAGPRELAEVDRRILEVLSTDARIPNSTLAARVGLAASTCHSRVRDLEERGVIRGYHADIDLEATGSPLQALVSVRLRAGARHLLRDFTTRMRSRPEVLDLYFLASDDDFLVHVAVPGSSALRDFVLEQLSAHPEVASTQTNIIFEHTWVAAFPGARADERA